MSEEISPESSDPDVPFDLEKLQKLMELMEKHGLTELNLKNDGQTWRLKRGLSEPIPVMSAPAAYQPPPMAAPPQQAAPAAQAAPTAPAETGVVIKAETVGTFYAAPSPDDPAYVTVGSKVQPDTTVCQIEAMKVFNPIPAGVSGTITAILAKNGESVEFDQPLFRVDPA